MQSPTNGVKITLNGVSYMQKGEEIMAKIERGEIPPPGKDRRRKLKLGAYTALVSEMIKRKFSNATIQKVLEDHGIKVNYNTVNKFCQIVRNRKPPVPRLTVGINPSISRPRKYNKANALTDAEKQTILNLMEVYQTAYEVAHAAKRVGVVAPFRNVYAFVHYRMTK